MRHAKIYFLQNGAAATCPTLTTGWSMLCAVPRAAMMPAYAHRPCGMREPANDRCCAPAAANTQSAGGVGVHVRARAGQRSDAGAVHLCFMQSCPEPPGQAVPEKLEMWTRSCLQPFWDAAHVSHRWSKSIALLSCCQPIRVTNASCAGAGRHDPAHVQGLRRGHAAAHPARHRPGAPGSHRSQPARLQRQGPAHARRRHQGTPPRAGGHFSM